MTTIGTAAGVLLKVAAKPLADAAMRRELVLRALKAVKLDPRVPPRDFDSVYAIALIEYCAGRAESVLAVFRDEYVIDSFRRSFADSDWARLRREVAEAVERNRETGEFGHLQHGFEEHVEGFVTAFHAVVDRSRAPHETRAEAKLDALLDHVVRLRNEEEDHRVRTEPGRAELTAAERLAHDAREWFTAVGYDVREQWPVPDGGVALLVDVPRRRRGEFDRTVALCVEGELGPHHLTVLGQLTEERGAREGWGIARLRVSDAARRQAERGGDGLFCYSFDELIDDEADFEPYLRWVEEEVRRRGIDERYVPLSCQKDELDPVTGRQLDTSVYRWTDGGLDDYVARWLDEPAKQHLSLLGEFGMGKSWFALHLAHTMVRAWRDAKRRGVPRPRIPLLIPLRDYAKQTTVQGLLAEFFFDKHKVDLRSSDVVRVLNRMGRLLLIFDGFDEMAARADRNTVVTNFWSLASAVDDGAKVLLSSRKEHFRDAQEARDLFGAKLSAAGHGASGHGAALNGPTFDIVELVPFDDEQIESMLRHDLAPDKVRRVMEHPDVLELMRRPVMSELVIDALPEIEQGAEIDLARVYLYAVRRKMDRDISEDRTFTSRADKLYFLCEVAWEMLSRNRLNLHYRDFPDHLRTCFGPAVQRATDLDFWEQDMRNQGMLVRNSEGYYGPSHKSLLEFLVALKFAAELGLLSGDFLDAVRDGDRPGDRARSRSWSQYFASRGADGRLPKLLGFAAEPAEALSRTFGSLPPNETVHRFLAAMVADHPDHRRDLLQLARSRRTGGLPANCLTLLLHTGAQLGGAWLPDTNLTGFDARAIGRRVSLRHATLRGSALVGATLAGTDLAGADLTGAQVSTELLSEGERRWNCLLTSTGGVVAWSREEIRHWPTGRLDDAPVVLPVTGTAQVREWDDGTWWLLDDEGGMFVDPGSGLRTGPTISDHGLLPFRLRGQLCLLGISGSGDIWDPALGQPVEQWQFPPGYVRGQVLAGKESVGLLAFADEEFTYFAADADKPGGWRAVNVLAHEPDHDRRIYSGSLNSALVLLDGRPVAVVDGTTSEALFDPDGRLLPRLPSNAVEGFDYRSRTGLVALAIEKRLSVRSLAADRDSVQEWERAFPGPGVAGVWADPAGERLAVATRMGELWMLDFRTGALLSRTALTDRLWGTRFSRDCGYDEETLAAVARLGGVVVD